MLQRQASKKSEQLQRQQTDSIQPEPSNTTAGREAPRTNAAHPAANDARPNAARPRFQVPALKVGGLGLSSIVGTDGKTQEERDVAALVKGNL